MTYSDYKGRGYLSDKLQDKILGQSELFNTLMNDPELDIRVREDEIHIYYNGGKLLEIDKSINPKIGDFDRKYTYRRNEIPNQEYKILSREERDRRMKTLSQGRYENIKKIIQDAYRKPNSYIALAKQIMDEWFDLNPNPERSDQHQIALANRIFTPQNDLVVLDIEFAVSFYSNCYNKRYIEEEFAKANKGKKITRYPNPRFDLIAVDIFGQIYVIELKTGCGSAGNASKHVRDFNHLVGSSEKGDNPQSTEVRWKSFLFEVKQILQTLQKYFNYSSDLKVDTTKQPIFCFAYTDKETDKTQLNKDRTKFVNKIHTSITQDPTLSKVPKIILIEKPDYHLNKRNILKN